MIFEFPFKKDFDFEAHYGPYLDFINAKNKKNSKNALATGIVFFLFGGAIKLAGPNQGLFFCCLGLFSCFWGYVINAKIIEVKKKFILKVTQMHEWHVQANDVKIVEVNVNYFYYKDSKQEIKLTWNAFLGYYDFEKSLGIFSEAGIFWMLAPDGIKPEEFADMSALIKSKMPVYKRE